MIYIIDPVKNYLGGMLSGVNSLNQSTMFPQSSQYPINTNLFFPPNFQESTNSIDLPKIPSNLMILVVFVS